MTIATTAEINADEDKIVKHQPFFLIFMWWNYFWKDGTKKLFSVSVGSQIFQKMLIVIIC